MFSKYTALLTIAGALIYLLTSAPHRRWLARPEPYLAGLAALAVFSPVVAWNATHHWASFAFQGGRAASPGVHPLGPLVVLAGEALFVLPWIWAGLLVAAVATLGRRRRDWRGWLLCCLGAPPIVVFALIAAWSGQRVLFHWAAPGYLMLFPLLGAWIAKNSLPLPLGEGRGEGGPRPRNPIRPAAIATAVFVLAGVAIVATQVRLDWLGLVLAHAKRDPDLEAIDWTSLRADLAARGLLTPATVVGVPDWRDAGKVAYGLGPGVTVICLSTDARQFGLNDPARNFIGRDMLIVAIDHPDRATRHLAPSFEEIDTLPPTGIRYDGRVLHEASLFAGRRLRSWPPPG